MKRTYTILLLAVANFLLLTLAGNGQTSTDEMTIVSVLDTIGQAPDSITYRTQQVYDKENKQLTYDSTYFNDPRTVPGGLLIAQVFRFAVNVPMPVTIVIEEFRGIGSDSAWVPLALKDPVTGALAASYTIDDSVVAANGSDTLCTGTVEVAAPISGNTATRVRRTSGSHRDHTLRCEQLKREDSY